MGKFKYFFVLFYKSITVVTFAPLVWYASKKSNEIKLRKESIEAAEESNRRNLEKYTELRIWFKLYLSLLIRFF